MVMHELVHYNLSNSYFEKPKPVKRSLSVPPNLQIPPSAINMEKMLKTESGFKRTGSFVIGQKLRESKWFSHEEHKVLCAVLETGFIVESKNQSGDTKYGVAVWTPGFGMYSVWFSCLTSFFVA